MRQLKSCFYLSHREISISETSIEIRFQIFMVVLTSLLWALLQYFYTTHYIGTTFILSSQYHLIAIFLGMNLSYFIFKSVIYAGVNTVFFERKKNIQWQKTLLFLVSMEGVMIFPAVLVRSYFDIPIQSITTYAIIVVVFVKLLTFYKSYAIFFRQIHPFFQIILYFCALEAVPMAAFWGAVAITGNYLNINF